MKVTIKNCWSNICLYEAEVPDDSPQPIRAAVEAATKSGVDLSCANLRHADLNYANLYNANLSHANLSHANLRYANLSYANLRDVDFGCADLYKTELSNADYSSSDLSNADYSSSLVDNYMKPIDMDKPLASGAYYKGTPITTPVKVAPVKAAEVDSLEPHQESYLDGIIKRARNIEL